MVKKYQPLLVTNEVLYCSKHNKLYVSKDHANTFELIATDATANFVESSSAFYNRISRGGLHYLLRLPSGDMVAIKRKQILFKRKASQIFEPVFSIPRGSRPLNMAQEPITGLLYFGEYFSNPDRKEVHIYGSKDGKEWFVAYTFVAKSIRHIHKIIYDPYQKGLWVLTGDEDYESHLWFTDDQFKTLRSIIGNTQRARAVSIIPFEGGLIVPTDTPREQNYIQYLDLNTLQFQKLAELPGSAMQATQVAADLFLVTTFVEPSPVNQEQYATVFASKNGMDWKQLFAYEKDWLSNISYKFFRYPELLLPEGLSNGPYLYLYGRGVKGLDGKMIRLDKNALRF